MALSGKSKKGLKQTFLKSLMEKENDKLLEQLTGLSEPEDRATRDLLASRLPRLRQVDYFEEFKALCNGYVDLTTAKNNDYAGAENALKNFTLVEFLTNGNITTEMGIIVRMCDKLQRVTNLLSGTKSKVQDEKVTDTIRDMAVYATILNIVVKTRAKNQEMKHRIMDKVVKTKSKKSRG